MNENDFLQLIEADPSDPVPRLVYADWLDEQGDSRGELIRLFVEVQSSLHRHRKWRVFLSHVCQEFEIRSLAHAHRVEKLIVKLDNRQRRLFACRCAESVLHHFESEYPADNRPRHAIDTARLFAKRQATVEELRAASFSASHAGLTRSGVRTISRCLAESAAEAAAAAANSSSRLRGSRCQPI